MISNVNFFKKTNVKSKKRTLKTLIIDFDNMQKGITLKFMHSYLKFTCLSQLSLNL